MKIAETELPVFDNYNYVPHLDRVTLQFRTSWPEQDQMWDSRFAVQGTREEMMQFAFDLLTFLEDAGDAGGCDARCAECDKPQAKKSAK